LYRICELYIDDRLIHGKDPETFLTNVRKVFERLREFNVAVNPKKTKLGLAEVEYVGHVVSAEGTSFTEEKRLKVLQFPLPETQKNLLQFIGLASYFRDHVPNITEMTIPLRKLIPRKSYKSNSKPRGHRGIRVLSAGHLELSRALLFGGHGDPDPTNRCLRLWHRGIPLHGHQWQDLRSSILQQSPRRAATKLVIQGERMLWHLLRSAALRGPVGQQTIHPQD
jgi:hypothetical protein